MAYEANDPTPNGTAAYLLGLAGIEFDVMHSLGVEFSYPQAEQMEELDDLLHRAGNENWVIAELKPNHYRMAQKVRRGRKPLPESAKRTQVSITISPETDRWLRSQASAEQSIGHVIDRIVREWAAAQAAE